ncbi:GntR family transcriptional regulator [Pseudonocardia spinosispora]|uniref:GntR family transcriptional regulator n=1 Tax=Pseudonocardia spinosispora TaxID=103441 RepID=UPI000417D1B8|nr:GntR family transcriptional regulator [Pseudonocardia spinosispora]
MTGSPDLQTLNTDCYGQVKLRLREVIAQQGSAGALRLPSEADLSQALGVSRATLRSALLSLQKEGRIRRLHGHGTFINRHALGIGANLAEAGAFMDLLAQEGYRPSVRTLDRRLVPLAEQEAGALELGEDETGLRITRVFLAGDEPAVHSVDLFPARLLPADHDRLDEQRSTFEFVSTHLGAPVCYSVARIRPVLPTPDVAAALRVSSTTPLLQLSHTHIRADERPVAVTVVHVNDAYLSFSVIRTYLDE